MRHSSTKALNTYADNRDGTSTLSIISVNGLILHFLIDSEDVPRVRALHWQKFDQGERIYARSVFPTKGYPHITLHSLVLSCPEQTKYTAIDHINRNTLDNRKENLRFTTKAVNNHNRRSTKTKNAHLPVGVFAAPAGRYKAVFSGGRVTRHLGTFDTPEEAKLAYTEFSKKYYSI